TSTMKSSALVRSRHARTLGVDRNTVMQVRGAPSASGSSCRNTCWYTYRDVGSCGGTLPRTVCASAGTRNTRPDPPGPSIAANPTFADGVNGATPGIGDDTRPAVDSSSHDQ